MVALMHAKRPPHQWDTATCAAVLATVRPLASLPVSMLNRLASICSPRHLPRGAFAFVEGDPARIVNVLATGRVKVIRETGTGREVILRLVTPGELIDGAGAWGEPVYLTSAVAQEESVALQLPAHELAACLNRYPDVGLAMIQELADHLREAERRIRDLQTERVEPRLARALLRLAGKTGVPSTLGLTIGVPLSRQDLAELAGTTISTASRTISGWEQHGIVAVGREQVTIRRIRALASIAEEPVSSALAAKCSSRGETSHRAGARGLAAPWSS